MATAQVRAAVAIYSRRKSGQQRQAAVGRFERGVVVDVAMT